MIVRDEGHIVREVLGSAAAHIDHWVIVDTGSVDDTREVIREFMQARAIPGELHERPWRDFGTNRTEALQLCAGTAEYAWVIDADDLVVGDLDLTTLTADSYLLRYGPDVTYWRKQLFRLGLRWRYEGRIHEYPACADLCTEARLTGDYHVKPRHLGARSRDPDTYLRDAALLREEVEAHPEDPRAAFYLAQSLFDANDRAGALEWYSRRTQMGGWAEEVFYAAMRRAQCLTLLGEPWEQALAAYLEAWNSRPNRAEPLQAIASRYREMGQHELAYRFAVWACSLPYPEGDSLFVDREVYAWRARDDAAVSAAYVGRQQESFDRCAALLEDPALPAIERARVRGNRDLSAASVQERSALYPGEVVRGLRRRVKGTARPQITATITTYRRPALFERTMNSFLNCCADAGRIGRWICADNGSAPADVQRMRELYPFLEIVEVKDGPGGHARSMNRLRELVESPYWLHLEDDWHFLVRSRYVTRALSILRDDSRIAQVAFNRSYAETLTEHDLIGGQVRSVKAGGERYRVHEFLDPAGAAWKRFLAALPAGSRTAAYWPHFTLRPSLMRTRSIKPLGEFDPIAPHFELEFAQRYHSAGHRTAFFDEVHCLHTGPLTSEKYGPPDLSPDRQHASVQREQPVIDRPRTPADVIVINLDRRQDRWGSFVESATAAAGGQFFSRCRRFSAVDGTTLRATPELRSLFAGNDFALRRGIVGCALSHIGVWRQVAAGDLPHCAVLEDDAELCDGFAQRLAAVDLLLQEGHNDFDLALLGYLAWHPDPGDGPGSSMTIRPMRWERYLGGLFAYVISARGAAKLLELVERGGVPHGIDRFVQSRGDELVTLECTPPLVTARNANGNPRVDSDIQHDEEPILGAHAPNEPMDGAPRLSSLAPSLQLGSVALDVTPSWPCRAAAIAGRGEDLRMLVTTASGEGSDVISYLVRLDGALQITAVEPIVVDAREPTASYDDLRLIEVDGTWLATAFRREGADGQPVRLTLDNAAIVDWSPLAIPAGSTAAPFDDQGQLRLLPVLPGVQRASNGTAVDGGWLFVARSAHLDAVAPHRLVRVDESHRVTAASPEFTVFGADGERCDGVAVVAGTLVLSLAADEQPATLAAVDLSEALALLAPWC